MYEAMENKSRKSLKAFTQNAKMKRDANIAKLSTSDEWQGLEEYQPINEDVNAFIAKFRKLYLSAKVMRFRDWMNEVDDLIDALE